jgi:predicted ATPase
LQRETEGNPFFLVEVVRALAEHVGQLDMVGLATPPSEIFTIGIQRIIQRRLQRIPSADLPLLQLSALAGRALDLSLLQLLAPDVALDGWLVTCANAAVLEIREDQWLFSHDKLRAGIVEQIPPTNRVKLHQRIAKTLEALYLDASECLITLAYHWAMAGDVTKEREYSILAGHDALTHGARQSADVSSRGAKRRGIT